MDSISNSPGTNPVTATATSTLKSGRRSVPRFDAETTATTVDDAPSFALVVKPSTTFNSNNRRSVAPRYSTTLSLYCPTPSTPAIRLPPPARAWRATILSANVREARVEYDVRSEFSSESFTASSVVRRRYRDFVDVHDSLVKSVKGYYILVPDLPPKSLVSTRSVRARAEPDFVTTRRIGLQLWLKYVCEHFVLRNSTALREFLFDFTTSAVTPSEVDPSMSESSMGGGSTTNALLSEMNHKREEEIWNQSLQLQSIATKIRFGNSLTSLASLKTRAEGLTTSYRRAARVGLELRSKDGKVVRGRARFSSSLLEWSNFEQSEGGQAFGFLTKFAKEFVAPTNADVRSFYASLSAGMANVKAAEATFGGGNHQQEEDASRLDVEQSNEEDGFYPKTRGGGDEEEFQSLERGEEFISSFLPSHPSSRSRGQKEQQQHQQEESRLVVVRKDVSDSALRRGRSAGTNHPLQWSNMVAGATIETPDAAGACLDVRSMESFEASFSFWGETILSKLAHEGSSVNPRDLSSSTRFKENHRAKRVSDEWTESENIRPKFLKEVCVKFVQDQILRARSEQERWKSLEVALLTQQAQLNQLSSLDAIDPSSYPSRVGGASASSKDDDLLDRIIQATQDDSSVRDDETPSTWAKTVVDEAIAGNRRQKQEQQQNAAHTVKTNDLDSDLDKAQELFRKLTSTTATDTTLVMNAPNELHGPTKYKNPFVHYDSDDGEDESLREEFEQDSRAVP